MFNRSFGGSGPFPRFYHLPLLTSCAKGCELCLSLGCRNEVNRELGDALRALDRAKSGQFDAVVFPIHFLEVSYRDELLGHCEQRGLGVVLQATAGAIDEARLSELRGLLARGCALNIVFTGSEPPTSALIDLMRTWPDSVIYTISVFKKDPVLETLKSLPKEVLQRLHFHFSYRLDPKDGRLSCRQVHALTEKIRRELPELQIRPQFGVEMWDPRVAPDLCLEPVIDPVFTSQVPHSDLKVSVVIPSYNNRIYLKNTIAHLMRQDLPRENFEIIVVDDGSDDGSEHEVIAQIAPEAGRVNFKYVYSPRAKPRKMGDANYRAGISRNLGVKHATGEILCFLDSDILTPSHFLNDLIAKHESWDVIQCKRLNLTKEKSTDAVRYEDVDPDSDIFHTDGGYWDEFYKVENWESIRYHWKYVCTYGLSMRLETFKKIGWLKRNFIFYGFEDTELGYRLAKAGYSFHLNEMVTYHLFHRNERSEFSNSDYLRHRLLKKTAQIFYRNLLEPEIFVHFRSFMSEDFSFDAHLRAWACRLGPVARRLESSMLRTTSSAKGRAERFLTALGRFRWGTKERLKKLLAPRLSSPILVHGSKAQARSASFVPLTPRPGLIAHRRFHAALVSTCDRRCRLCEAIGCLHFRTLGFEEVRSLLLAAARDSYDSVVFKPNALDHSSFPEIMSLARAIGLKPVLQLHVFELDSKHADWLIQPENSDLEIELLIDRPPARSLLRWLNASDARVTPVIIAMKDLDPVAAIRSLPGVWQNKVQLYAPLSTGPSSPFWNPDEVHRWIESVPNIGDEFSITPYSDLDRTGLPNDSQAKFEALVAEWRQKRMQCLSFETDAESVDPLAAKLFYLATLDDDVYRTHFAALGECPRLRSALSFLASHKLSRPILSSAHYALFLYHLENRVRYFKDKAREEWKPVLVEWIWWSTLWPILDALRSNLWRLDVARERFVGSTKREFARLASLVWWSFLRPAFDRVRGSTWRISVIEKRLEGFARRIGHRVSDSVWWSFLWPAIDRVRGNTWRISVIGKRLEGFIRRVALRASDCVWWSFLWPAFDRVRSNAWRLRVLRIRLMSFVTGVLQRLIELVWWKTLWRVWSANLWFFRDPINWLRQKAPPLYWICVHPFLKVYYFSEYQWRKRVLGRANLLDTSENIGLMPIKEDVDAK